jgi:hypothetical protein
MCGTIRLAAVLAAAALVSAACTSDPTGSQLTTTTSASTTRSSKPAPPDTNLRNVARAAIYGDGIAYVLPETAAQMICGALSPAEWRTVLGSDVGRAVYGDVDAKCRLSSGSVTIDMTGTVQALGAVGERIADRRVTIEPSSASGRVAAAQAALVPLAEQDIPAQQRVGAEPVLHLLAQTTIDLEQADAAPDLLPGLLRRVLAALLPRLTPHGPATPVEAAGTLTFTATEPVAGVPIYDLPQTVQSLVLCTVVPRESGIKPSVGGIFVDSVSECQIGKPARIFTKVDRFLPAVQEQFTIAGHPAQEIADVGIVIDLLTMPNEYGTEARHLTLRLQNYRSSAQLRAWAGKVAPPLLAAA